MFVLDRTVDDDVAAAAAPCIGGHLTFGDAPVTRFIDDDTMVELIGTIRSSSATLDLLFVDFGGDIEAL